MKRARETSTTVSDCKRRRFNFFLDLPLDVKALILEFVFEENPYMLVILRVLNYEFYNLVTSPAIMSVFHNCLGNPFRLRKLIPRVNFFSNADHRFRLLLDKYKRFTIINLRQYKLLNCALLQALHRCISTPYELRWNFREGGMNWKLTRLTCLYSGDDKTCNLLMSVLTDYLRFKNSPVKRIASVTTCEQYAVAKAMITTLFSHEIKQKYIKSVPTYKSLQDLERLMTFRLDKDLSTLKIEKYEHILEACLFSDDVAVDELIKVVWREKSCVERTQLWNLYKSALHAKLFASAYKHNHALFDGLLTFVTSSHTCLELKEPLWKRLDTLRGIRDASCILKLWSTLQLPTRHLTEFHNSPGSDEGDMFSTQKHQSIWFLLPKRNISSKLLYTVVAPLFRLESEAGTKKLNGYNLVARKLYQLLHLTPLTTLVKTGVYRTKLKELNQFLEHRLPSPFFDSLLQNIRNIINIH